MEKVAGFVLVRQAAWRSLVPCICRKTAPLVDTCSARRSGWTVARVEATARALRTLLVGATALHRHLADAAGVGHLIEQRGLLHVYPARASFAADGLAWGIRRQVGIGGDELSQELREREPDLDVRYGFGVLVEEAGRCLDPGGYVAALVAHARSRALN